MPKRQKGNRNDITVVPFKTVWIPTFANSGTVVSFQITTSNSSLERVYPMRQLYEFYRFTKLTASIFPFTDTTQTNNQGFVLAYEAEVASSPPANVRDAMEQKYTAIITSAQSCPSHLRIPQRGLLSLPEKWFAQNSGGSPYAAVQGQLNLVPYAFSTSTVFVVITGLCEMRGPTILSESFRIVPKNDEELEQKCEELKRTVALLTKRRSQ